MTASPGHVLVAGAGVFGATTALELTRRGWTVTLLDPDPPPAEGASSTDVSKLVRMDYGSDLFYHELAEAALAGWDRWNEQWPEPLYHEDGLLVLSRGAMAPGGFEYESWQGLVRRGYQLERIPSDLTARFPAWRSSEYTDGYLSHRAGWVESEEVVARTVDSALRAGVEVRRTGLRSLITEGSRAAGAMTGSGEVIAADRVVVAAGAWTPYLLPWLSDRLWAVGQPVVHLAPRDPEPYRAPRFPPWMADTANSGWYGFPALPDGRVKIGHHGRGVPGHPDGRGEVGEAHVARTRAFLRQAIPSLAEAPLAGQRVCMYCDTFDGDFLIDHDPEREGLVVAAGGSGHGFKFAPLLGSLVADVLERRPNPWARRFKWRTAGEAGREQSRFLGG